MVTKACHPIVNQACFTLNNGGVSPVETQNLASHKQKVWQRQAFIRLTLSRILARETLEARQRRAFTHLTSLRILACETQNFGSHKQKVWQRQAYIHLALLLILACETQDFASLLWITHIYSALFSCIKRWRL